MLFGLILLLVTAASCILFAVQPAWFPLPITADALSFDRQFTWTLWITGFIFIIVQLLLAWAVLRKTTAFATRHQKRLEWTWTSTTAILFITLAVLGSRGWAKVATPGPGKEIIRVDAHQFAWNFHYPGPDGKFGYTDIKLINDANGNPEGLDPRDTGGTDDIVSSTLRIPAGRNVLLLLHSRDMIHDFFVRELRTKQDIVPGMEIPLELNVPLPGTYEIACAELCGLGHSQMRSLLIVMPAAEYDQWKAKR